MHEASASEQANMVLTVSITSNQIVTNPIAIALEVSNRVCELCGERKIKIHASG